MFRGFPQSYGFIKGINIHPVRYTDLNVVTTPMDLATLDSDPLYNCKGFSGSGIFCEINSQLFLAGILYQFEEPFKRFSVCDLSFINDLLANNALPGVVYASFPKDATLLHDINVIALCTKLVLDGINNRLGHDFSLVRENLSKDFRNKFNNNKLLIIKGVAGVGKSAFAKTELLELINSQFTVIGFKADYLAKETLLDVFPGLGHQFPEILNELCQDQQIVIFIDSFEKILEVNTHEALRELLRFSALYNNMTLLQKGLDKKGQKLI